MHDDENVSRFSSPPRSFACGLCCSSASVFVSLGVLIETVGEAMGRKGDDFQHDPSIPRNLGEFAYPSFGDFGIVFGPRRIGSPKPRGHLTPTHLYQDHEIIRKERALVRTDFM